MSDQGSSSTTTGPDSHTPGPHLRNHRVVRSEDLPRFSIGAPVATGMIIWFVLLAVALVKHDQLAADGHTWWIWCTVAGVVLGTLGWLYIMVKLKDQPGQVMEPPGPGATKPPPPGLRD